MPFVKLKSMRAFVLTVALLSGSRALPLIGDARAETAAPFAGLSGKWSGDGSIVLTNGQTERLRCDSSDAISGGGSNLDMSLKCVSDTYSFDLRISLADTSGQILGNWTEVTKNVSGGISGADSKGRILLKVQGQSFGADVTVVTRGNQQNVKIAAQSGNLSNVSITLRRKG
jgi:hypothetical protein